MKPILLLLCALCFLTIGCKTAELERLNVTSHATAVVGDAKVATNEAAKASERSSAHIKAFKNDAERIQYDLDQMDYKESKIRGLRIMSHP